MDRTKIEELFKKYGLTKSDYFQHKHYEIITRQGIDKIQAKERISIVYEAVKVEPEFCVIKAKASKGAASIETFGSAKYGGKEWNKSRNNGKGGWDEHGNTTTWYIAEMAEKRAMSRAVLKLTGFYELGVFGEDESEDFKRTETPPPKTIETNWSAIANEFKEAKSVSEIKTIWSNHKKLQTVKRFIDLKESKKNILIQNGITE